MGSNAERQKRFRERVKERVSLGLPPVMASLERRAQQDRKDREKAHAEQTELNKNLTREWVLDQLRHFILHPSEATPAGVQAAKVLLEALPRTTGKDPLASDATPSNEVQFDTERKEDDDDILA